MMRLQVILSRPLSHRVDLEMKLLKSPEACCEPSLALQHGVDSVLIADTWKAAFSAELPGLLGCVGVGAVSKRLHNELASTAWMLVCSLVAQLTQGLWSQKFLLPFAFVGLVSDNQSHVQEALTHAQRCWKLMLELESTGLPNPDCKAFCNSMPCREILVLLREHRFQHLPPFLERQLRDYASTFRGTLIIENCFKEMRAAQRKNMSSQPPPESAWHLAFHSKWLSEYGHKSLPVASQSLDESSEVLSRDLFERPPASEDCSISLDAISDKRGWAAMSYEAWNSSSVRMMAAMKIKGKWTELCQAWQSHLLLPRSFAVHTPSQNGYLILHSSSWGCTAWECSVRALEAKRDEAGYRLDGQKLAAGQLQLVLVTNVDEWLAYSVTPQMPQTAGLPMELHLEGRKTPLYQFAAQRGFQNVPLPCLHRLLRSTGMPGESSAKTDVVRKLIRDAFPNISDDELLKFESNDGSGGEGHQYEPVMANDSLLAELREVEEEGDQQEAAALL